MPRPLRFFPRSPKYHNVRVYFCPPCDVGFPAKEGWEAHLGREPGHRTNRVVFDSGREFEYFRTLELRAKAGEISGFEIHPSIVVYSGYPSIEKIGWAWEERWKNRDFKDSKVLFRYRPDFVTYNKDSDLDQIIDIKGRSKHSDRRGHRWSTETESFKIKKQILEALMGREITVIYK